MRNAQIDDDDWQQVGKGKSKVKGPPSQNVIRKMPKVKNIDSIQTLLNQYDPNDVGEPLQDTSNIKKKMKGSKEPVKLVEPKVEIKKRPKKTAPEPRFSYKSIDDALAKDNFELQEKYEQVQTAFPGNTSVWQKEVSHHLNMKLNCPDEVLSFNSRPFDFPLSNMKKDTSKLLKKIYSEGTNDNSATSLFFQYVISTTECIARDIPVWGFRLCIQTLAITHPKAICQDLNRYKNKVESLLNVSNQCLSVIWSVGQVAKSNQKFGFQVWLQVMLPCLHNKQVAQYAMSYIEMIFNKTKNPAEALASSLNFSDFLKVAQLCYSENNSIKRTVATRDRLRKLFPVFQKMLLRQKSNLRQFFSELLHQTPENQALSVVYNEVMTECLHLEPSCFKIWRDKYLSCTSQTRTLLSYFNDHWADVSATLPQKPFRETVRSFVKINTAAESKHDNFFNSRDFGKIKNLCTTIQSHFETTISASRSSIRGRFLAIIFALLACVAFYVHNDLRSHKYVWEKTKTYDFLKLYGIITYIDILWNKANEQTRISVSWLTLNVPIYWRTVSDILGPYFNELLSYLCSAGVYVQEASQPIRIYVLEHGSVAVQFIVENLKVGALLFLDFVDVCVNRGYVIALWLLESLKIIYASIYKLYIGEITWDAVQLAINSYTALTYEYVLRGLHKLGDYIAPNKP